MEKGRYNLANNFEKITRMIGWQTLPWKQCWLVAAMVFPCVVYSSDIEVVTRNDNIARFQIPVGLNWISKVNFEYRFNNSEYRKYDCSSMSYCNISSSWSIKDEEKNSMANIGEVHVHSLVANTKTKIDLKFTNESSTFVVTIYTLGPKFNHSALKTSNVVDQFASYHFRCLRSAKLFVSKRNEELTGLRCEPGRWCLNRVFWMVHRKKKPQKSFFCSVTVDIKEAGNILNYEFVYLANSSVSQTFYPSIDREYPVALKRCANVAKFNSRRYLPLDSTYFPSTSSLFVLPNNRTIGMKTCNMSIEEHNLSFWTSYTAKNINLKNVLKNQLELPEKSAFRVMVTFDNQESAAGVYYFFVNGIQSKPKYPDSVLLRNTVDERKATFELPAIRPVNSQPLLFVSDSRKYSATFLGFKFDKDVVYELKHQIKWTSFQRKGNSFISFQVTVNNQSDYESENSEEDDPLDLHVYISDEKHVHTKKCRYYRLLVFPTEIPTLRIHPKPAGNETNHTVSYEIKVNRAKWLVDQLYIFPALGKSGTKCVKEQNCQDLVIFDSSKKGKGKKKSIFLEVTLLAHDIENLTDYAIFVMDPGKRRFQIYQFDSSSRYSPATAPIGTKDPPVTYTTTTPASSAGFGNEWAFLLMIPFGIATGAFFLVLYVRRRRVHFGKVSADTADQAAFETSQRRFSDGYEVLPGDRVSGDYEHIVEDRSYEHLVEDRRLSHGYEAILCQDFPRNNLRDATSNVYQTMSLENVECLPQATKPFSKMNGASLKHSLSCSNITDAKVDTFAHAGDTRIYVEDDSELFFKSHSVTGHRNANKEQLALKYFMLRDSTDDARCVNPFYTTDVKETRENIELQDSSTRRRCSANADGECEYLTVLDSSEDDGNYLELIPD